MFGVVFNDDLQKSLRGYHLLNAEKETTGEDIKPKLKYLRRWIYGAIISTCVVAIFIVALLTFRPIAPKQMLVSTLLSRLNSSSPAPGFISMLTSRHSPPDSRDVHTQATVYR